MRDNEKSKAQLIKDLSTLRKQVREFEDLQVGILAEMTSAAIFIYQMNRVKYVNPAATKITGYTRDELLRMNFWEVIHQEFQELVKKRGMARQKGEKVPSRYEIKIQMKGGEERWVDYSARVTTFEQNPAVLGTAVDITERKRTEQALLESEERYRTLSEAAFEGIIISVSGKLVMANQAFAEMFGYDSHEVIGLSAFEMTTPESADIIMKNIQSSHEKPYEVIGVRKDGSTFNLEIMGKDCLYKSRKARVTAVRDITERKRTEEALRLVAFGTSGAVGESFLQSLVQHLAEALNVRFAFISEVHKTIAGRVRLLALWEGDRLGDCFEYEIKGTPCEHVVGKKLIHYPDGVQRLFPDDAWLKEKGVDAYLAIPLFDSQERPLGHLGVMHDKPLQKEVAVESLLKVFAARAAAEMEREQAEEALSRSESKFRVLSETTSAAIFIFQRNRMRYVNPAATNITGYTQKELLKMNFWEVIHPDFRSLVKERGIARQKGKKVRKRYEVKIQTKNGEERWVDFTASAIEFNQKPAVLGTAVNITERKRAEEHIAGLKSFYEQLLEHLPIQLAVLDKNFRYDYLNPHSIKDPQMRKWLIGKTDLDYCRKRGLDLKIGRRRQTWFKNVISSKKSSSYEETLPTSSGEERQFLRVASPVMGPDGDVIQIVGYGLDITENKLAEKELENSLSLLRSTLESTADGILVVDEEGKIVSFNQKFLEMWHIPDSIIASRDDDEVIAFVLNQLEDPEEFLTQVRRLYSEPEAKSFDILSFKDGRIFERYSLAQRIGDKIVGRVWSFRDITERKQIEAQLLQSQKMETIGTLAGGVAHDFNNILTAIVGNAELGMQYLDPDHHPYDDLDEIKKAAIKASDLTNQLLSFSRRQVLKKQSFNLNQVVEDLLKMLKRILGEDIELKTRFSRSLPPVFADKGQIDQILMNLVTNARDAMPGGGRLFIKTRSVQSNHLAKHQNGKKSGKAYVQLTVTDTGLGMDKETQAHIFEPFFTTKELDKGTGLGLAVVYGIVKQHEGHLEIESDIDKGTTFKIFLPAATERQEKRRQTKNRLNTWQGGSETILIVEDEEIVRNVAVRIVSGLGYKVLLAKNGEEAMEIFNPEKNSIDLVLMDVVMPKESGPEVYKKMSSINPKLPVLFVTGYDAESKVSNLTQDFNQALIALLQKPYSKEILGQKIRELLDK